jgi:tetratricopeptide (TPR) repeat protein
MPLSRLASLRVALYQVVGTLFLTKRTAKLAEMIFKRGLKYSERKGSVPFIDSFNERIAATYDVRGDKAIALRMLQKRIDSDPQKARYYFDLAEFYVLNNEHSRAIENYEEALQRETDEEWRRMIQAELTRLRAPASPS